MSRLAQHRGLLPSNVSIARHYASTSSRLSTANASELEHFTRLASEWWKPNSEYRILSRMNEPRIDLLRERLARHEPHLLRQAQLLQGKRVLDVGCGGGIFSEVFLFPQLLLLCIMIEKGKTDAGTPRRFNIRHRRCARQHRSGKSTRSPRPRLWLELGPFIPAFYG